MSDPQYPSSAHAAGEESYLASLSDLMVGLLFIFIIILMAFALNLRKAETETQQSTEQLRTETQQQQQEQVRLKTETEQLKLEQFRLMQETEVYIEQQLRLRQEKERLENVIEQLTNNNAVRQALLEDIQQDLAVRGVRVFVDEKNGILRLPEALLFASGEAQFSTEGYAALKDLALVLATILPCYSLWTAEFMGECGDVPPQARLEAVFIEGHTDDRPIRTPEYADNWALASARAFNTYQTLITEAPILDQLQNQQQQTLLSVSAYEARRPVAPNDSEPNRRNNRRIDLRFIMSSPPPELIEEAQQRLHGAE